MFKHLLTGGNHRRPLRVVVWIWEQIYCSSINVGSSSQPLSSTGSFGSLELWLLYLLFYLHVVYN